MASIDLTAARVRELFDYSSDDGALRWRVSGPKRVVGTAAGSRQRIGYIVIRVDGVLHYAHRLAWLHVTGEWPTASVDHIDGDKGNNRWLNLRDVTQQANCENQHKAQGSSGLLGAAKNSRHGNWRAIITANGRQKHIGTFSTPEEANAAYLAERSRRAPRAERTIKSAPKELRPLVKETLN